MIVAHTIAEVRGALAELRRKGQSLGLVPTMGALHAGHFSLVEQARSDCDAVVVSIFVNPIQFGPNEDFNKYPRPIEADLAGCRKHGVSVVFNPSPKEMYPAPRMTTVHVDTLTTTLCGAHRPGHFDGVTTVVSKLFNIIQPDFAYFGQKDAQQALTLYRMVRDLDFAIEMRVCPTIREASGLAMSSRNQYLSDTDREQALALSRSLKLAAELIQCGERSPETIIAQMRQLIHSNELDDIDYISIVDPATIQPVAQIDREVLIGLAVRVGPARLIDNILLDHTGNEITMNHLFRTWRQRSR
jgi:pantoate--beta-alanine ligase